MTDSTFTTATQPPRSKLLLAWMIISQLLGLAVMLVLLGGGIFGFLLEGKITFLWFMVFFSPALMLIPLVSSWVAYGKRQQKLAGILTSLPIAYACLDLTIYASMIFL